LAAEAGRLLPSAELIEGLNSLKAELAMEQAKVDDTRKPLSVKLGELLVMRQVRIPEMVTQWAKRGVEPITKFEFRLHVRKLMEQAQAKDIDGLFDSFDSDHGGSLDVAELRQCLKGLKDAASGASRERAETTGLVERLQERLSQAEDVMAKTLASEEAEVKLEELRANKGVGPRLGQLLVTRNVKITDVVTSWDTDGTGEMDKNVFRKHVLGMGLVAEDAEIYDLFDSLDGDSGGTLDMGEVKNALKTLQDAAGNADGEVARLKKSTGELWKVAKTAQVELKKVRKIDETRDAERKAATKAELEAKLAVQQEMKAAKARVAEKRRLAAEEDKKAFEAKIEVRRRQHAEKLEMEKKAFSDACLLAVASLTE